MNRRPAICHRHSRSLTRAVLAAALAVSLAGPATAWIDEPPGNVPKAAPAEGPGAAEARLKDLVPKLRAENKLVGLGAMVMIDGKRVAAAINGERKKGSGVPLEVDDRWHLGSITKSITATMIARLVQRGQFQWSTTIGECLGKSIEVHEDWRDVTLEMLLTHTSGAPANFPSITQFLHPPEGEGRVKARMTAVAALLGKQQNRRGETRFRYSNAGYAVAAAMVEHQTGTAWESLIRKEVFEPLKILHAGFGPPQDDKQPLDQPRGHQHLGLLKRAAGAAEDNTPIIGPAGSVHMTLADLCTYGGEHLSGERGQGKLLKAETYQRLHAPKSSSYAFGWVAPKENQWTDERILWHNGSNTMWYALIALLPESNAVVAVVSNDGDIKQAEQAAFRIVREFAKPKSPGEQ